MAIVTLLTDFGLSDSYVAEIKAAMLAVADDIRFIDITHEIALGDVQSAQYLLDRTWHRFPVGSVHVAIVDPGVGTSRRAIAAQSHGHCFVAPDNGILTTVLDGATVVELPVRDQAAPTFHGRDVFAPAAAQLAAGIAIEEVGRPFDGWHRVPLPVARLIGGDMVGAVVHVDGFGTLVSNVRGEDLAPDAVVTVGTVVVGPLQRTFGDVESGELLGFVGSAGTVEIAVRDASAVHQLGVGVGTVVRVKHAIPR
ncbi:MAG TPA: SAM-dependent chlorinase/fluorinase [Gemmatimonadales bacterium]